MTGALRRRISEILRRLRSTGDAGPEVSAAPGATPPVGHAQPTRDLAVVIPTPPGVPPGVDAPPLGRLLVERRATRPQDVTLAVIQQGEGDDRPLGEILVDHGATTAAHVVEALEHQAEAKRSAAAMSVRVDLAVLDALAQLADELADTQNGLRADGADDALIARLARISTELQETIRTTRPRESDPRRDPGS